MHASYIHSLVYTHTHVSALCVCVRVYMHSDSVFSYEVAMISRLLKIPGLFCRI